MGDPNASFPVTESLLSPAMASLAATWLAARPAALAVPAAHDGAEQEAALERIDYAEDAIAAIPALTVGDALLKPAVAEPDYRIRDRSDSDAPSWDLVRDATNCLIRLLGQTSALEPHS